MRPWRVLVGCFICLASFSAFWLFLSEREIIDIEEEDWIADGQQNKRYALHRSLPEKLRGKELEFHQIFEPRIVSFDGYPIPTVIDNTTKTILLWTPWNGVRNTINYYFLRPGNVSFTSYNCPNTHCTVTWNRSMLPHADAVLFNIRDIRDTKYKDVPERLRNNPNQRWIGYILEAPWLCEMHWNKFDGLFNWTMSYREDSDIVVKYGFIGRRNPEEPTPEPSQPIPFSERRSVVWFVSDCKTDSKREKYVEELKRHIDVDVYGKCGDKKCFPAQSSACYGDVLVRYKFYLSFENSLCKDYVTEKFFNVLEYDVLPVVFGGAPYRKLAPRGSFVNAVNYPHPKDLAKHLKKLGSNEESYRKHFIWKNTHRAYLYPWTCAFCDKLHEPVKSFAPAKTNLKKWWMSQAECKRWADSKFSPVDY